MNGTNFTEEHLRWMLGKAHERLLELTLANDRLRIVNKAISEELSDMQARYINTLKVHQTEP